MPSPLLIGGGLLAALVAYAVVMSLRPLSADKATAAIESLFRRTVARDRSVRHGFLLVDAPSLGIELRMAEGKSRGAPVREETPFLSASVGKLFTATAVLSLVEEGKLALDDRLGKWLDPELLARLPVQGGAEAAAGITVAQLLGHRSGLPDYYEGVTRDGAPNVSTLLVQEPNRTWTVQSLLDYTCEHFEPAGAPGEGWLYSDTNYDLAGLIIERADGRRFHEAVRARVMNPLNLRSTWYHALESSAASVTPKIAEVWFGEHQAIDTPATTLDTAGGGLATTLEDLRLFMRGLTRGTPVPLEAFQARWTEDTHAAGIDYALGLWRLRPAGLSVLLRGYPDLYGASGSTGSFVYYVPDLDAVIAGTFDQTGHGQKHIVFLIRLLSTLRRVRRAG